MRALAAIVSLTILASVAELAAQTWAGTLTMLVGLALIIRVLWRWEA